eukprot:4261849-Pyramimonas_sp.AAC.2
MGRARAATEPVPTSTSPANCLRRGEPGRRARDCAEPPNKKRVHTHDSSMLTRSTGATGVIAGPTQRNASKQREHGL